MENLERLKDKPVYITENGCNTDDDRFRIVYIALHLAAARQAMDYGVDIRSYLYWSLIDNYEWGSYDPKYGLAGFDATTFETAAAAERIFLQGRDKLEFNLRGDRREISAASAIHVRQA